MPRPKCSLRIMLEIWQRRSGSPNRLWSRFRLLIESDVGNVSVLEVSAPYLGRHFNRERRAVMERQAAQLST